MNGLGFLIWQLDKIRKSYTPIQLADLLFQASVRWVSWKVSDGAYPFNQISGDDKLLMEYICALSAAGIQSGGWSYVYPRPVSPLTQAARINERVKTLGLSHIMLDVEAEWKASAITNANVDQLVNSIEPIPLGFCSYRYPAWHPGIKYTRFLGNPKMIFNAPQVYWEGAHNPEYQLEKSYNQYTPLTSMPFIPIGSSYGRSDWLPTCDDFTHFVDKCERSGWTCYGFYSLDWLLSHGHLDWLEAISGATITPPAPPVPPTPGQGMTFRVMADLLNVRAGPGTQYSDIGDLHAGDIVTAQNIGGSSAWIEIMPGHWACVQSGVTVFMVKV